MQELSLELAAVEPSGRMKLVIEAVAKIQQGKKLFEEGHLELSNLLGEKATKKELRKHEERDSTFKMDVRKDDDLMEKMVNLIRSNRQASTKLFATKLRVGDRRLDRLIGKLVKSKTIEDIGSGGRHSWVLRSKKPTKNKAAKKAAKTKKDKKVGKVENNIKVNGHKILKGVHGAIDVSDQKLTDKALEFLKTHDWVSQGKLLRGIDVSFYPGNRLLEHLEKQKLVKQVFKKNNPEHEKNKAAFSREFPYWELT